MNPPPHAPVLGSPRSFQALQEDCQVDAEQCLKLGDRKEPPTMRAPPSPPGRRTAVTPRPWRSEHSRE
eukprot:8688778-Alexandrium_andersonii.AAC.1